MALFFITGNKNKLEEVRAVLPEVEQLDIDLPEIQELDPAVIIESKLAEAQKHHDGEFIVEDTSLYLDCLNGLPGPLIKWFLKSIGNEGLSNLTEKLGNNQAVARTVIGYAKQGQAPQFFTGEIKGSIVAPRGETTFGWDPIFQPSGHNKTFAEMSADEKNTMSMRRQAVEQLKSAI